MILQKTYPNVAAPAPFAQKSYTSSSPTNAVSVSTMNELLDSNSNPKGTFYFYRKFNVC